MLTKKITTSTTTFFVLVKETNTGPTSWKKSDTLQAHTLLVQHAPPSIERIREFGIRVTSEIRLEIQNSHVRFYVSLIVSGEGRHTTHPLKCVRLLSTSQTDWRQSSDILSDISFDILSDILSDISSDIVSDILSGIPPDILAYILSDISSDIVF